MNLKVMEQAHCLTLEVVEAKAEKTHFFAIGPTS
jgi:hypothetical protein